MDELGPCEPFAVHEAVYGAHHTLALSGELDIVSAAELEARLREVSSDGTTGITLDLSRVTFMDSAGLRAVLYAKELADSHECEFAVIPGPPNVQRLFELAALLNVLPFEIGGRTPTMLGGASGPEELAS